MSKLQKISFIGFILVALGLATNGIIYLLADKIMPYHLVAMGSSWENLPRGIQIMSLNFMQSAGAGFLTTSIALLFLLWFPFRQGELWARWAILIIALNEILLVTFRVIDVGTNTPAKPPFSLLIIIIAITIISFILSFCNCKNKKTTQ